MENSYHSDIPIFLDRSFHCLSNSFNLFRAVNDDLCSFIPFLLKHLFSCEICSYSLVFFPVVCYNTGVRFGFLYSFLKNGAFK